MLTSLGNFPRDNAETVLLNGMNDSSDDVRETAANVAMNGMQPETLKTSLSNLMLDKGQPKSIRESSYIALSFYNLENENYETVKQFGEYLKKLYPEN